MSAGPIRFIDAGRRNGFRRTRGGHAAGRVAGIVRGPARAGQALSSISMESISHGFWPAMLAAAWIGAAHTLAGPDHYLPFIALARAGAWSLRRTLAVALLCGVAHVASSILLACAGLWLFRSLGGSLEVLIERLLGIEGARGDVAAWLLLGLGLVYTIFGLRAAYRNRPHAHWHTHADGTIHVHDHTHNADHAHVHARRLSPDQNIEPTTPALASEPHAQDCASTAGGLWTPWMLFLVFVFGPCEPLIPLMLPAWQIAPWLGLGVAAAFSLSTLMTMLCTVAIGYYGLRTITFGGWSRYNHAIAGGTVTLCAVAMLSGL